MTSKTLCQFLPWDTEFFGQRIAKINTTSLDKTHISDIMRWSESNAIDCLYFLAEADDAATVRIAEDHNFRFKDIRVTLEYDFKRNTLPTDETANTLVVRPSQPNDIPKLEHIAEGSYIASRFYYDPCFPREKCNELYRIWIRKSCEDYADITLVGLIDGQPAGYISCHLLDEGKRGDIGLVGVAESARGLSLGQQLVNAALHWFAEQGVERVTVVTQGRNVPAQRLYQRCGFLMYSVQLWYHKWLTNCHDTV